LNSALNREIAISGNGAAAERRRFPVPAGALPPTVPRLDLIRPFCIQRPELEDTASPVYFAKESLRFGEIKPAVQGAFPHRVLFF
jgi:hypothetical protein